jgi:hypothetical protein
MDEDDAYVIAMTNFGCGILVGIVLSSIIWLIYWS